MCTINCGKHRLLLSPYTVQYQTLVEIRILGCRQLTVVVDNVMTNGDVGSEEMMEKYERDKGTRELIAAFMKLQCVEVMADRIAGEKKDERSFVALKNLGKLVFEWNRILHSCITVKKTYTVLVWSNNLSASRGLLWGKVDIILTCTIHSHFQSHLSFTRNVTVDRGSKSSQIFRGYELAPDDRSSAFSHSSLNSSVTESSI